MSARKKVMWSLEEALHYIRVRQKSAFKHGYNLGLTGGVMENGRSLHDLDIVCVPANGLKANAPNYFNFINFLHVVNHEFVSDGAWNEITRKFQFRTENGKLVDYFVTFNPKEASHER